MRRAWFITGTDTGIGKTVAASAIVAGLVARGYRTVGLKPIASGCEATAAGLRNADALALQAASNVDLRYEAINPFAFAPPIAPHTAAEQAAVALDAVTVADAVRAATLSAECAVIEGVGGWEVPLNSRETVADLARVLAVPVVVVVGMRLGCLNHALLTVAAVERGGLPLAGWIANRIDPDMAAYEANRDTLRARLKAPLLGELPWLAAPTPAALSAHLELDRLFE